MKAIIICIYLSKATFSDFYSIYAIDVVTLSHFKSINAIDVTRVKCRMSNIKRKMSNVNKVNLLSERTSLEFLQ